MDWNITLTPSELYYLGTILQAKYIDYAYVAAMDDIRKNRAVYELQSRSELVKAGVLSEDFVGNLEVVSNAKELLMPIFFGEFESCIDITSLGENPGVNTRRFHSYNGFTTMVTSTDDGKLQIDSVDNEKIIEIVGKLLPDSYSCTVATVLEDIPKEKVARIIAVKNTVIGKSAVVKLYVEADGVIYSESSLNVIESMISDDFINSVLNIVRGAA